MWNDLPCDVIDEILSWSGPMRMGTHVHVVAARRIQRRWRRMRLQDGTTVMYRFVWMKSWEIGSVFYADKVCCLRGKGRLVFDARRLGVRIIPLSA